MVRAVPEAAQLCVRHLFAAAQRDDEILPVSCFPGFERSEDGSYLQHCEPSE